ncbi:hypothetical protein [Gracilibacillus thailandensis]|uniref:DUF3156 family protein n=1 Tax=Gracilibacillus thailandensis TaxID=563735 RepID=A0A6N7QY64_9BACI|nr:hypothetical protein [Gracilibacillus thailandensis]MRI67113.1 hypothetical protein [Gracilibacillus thailandensis]
MFTNIERRASKHFKEIFLLFNLPVTDPVKLSWKYNVSAEKKWLFRFILDKRLLTRIYKFTINYSFTISDTSDKPIAIHWDYRKKKWVSDQNSHSFCQLLNQNYRLKNVIQQLDLEQLAIKQNGRDIIITEVPLPGSFMFTLLPPMQYLIKLKHEEITALKKIPLLIQHSIQA